MLLYNWRPSIYGCNKRRHNNAECQNKYISDIVLGPFVFNYIANIIRAKGRFTKRTTLDSLQRMLLRGDAFAQVESINGRDTLLSQKNKHETAMNRLKPLYLYGDGDPTEKDYMIERQRILDALAEVDQKLNDLKDEDADTGPLSNDGFLAKASYFIMAQQLQDKRFVDYERFIRKIDQQSVVQNFCIKDGRIVSILFKNGIEHQFFYKD